MGYRGGHPAQGRQLLVLRQFGLRFFQIPCALLNTSLKGPVRLLKRLLRSGQFGYILNGQYKLVMLSHSNRVECV